MPASKTDVHLMRLQKLYIRIWLAVVLALAVLTLTLGWMWHMSSDAPLREVVVRDQSGKIIGRGVAHYLHPRAQAGSPAGTESENPSGRYGEGPEFDVQMQNGDELHLHLPRAPRLLPRTPVNYFTLIGIVGLFVSLATYPVVRRLTRRLESLSKSVDQWGLGDLATRAKVSGDDEVAVLAARFNHAAQQIETLVHTRDNLLSAQKSMLANVSHELRSPLARIRMGLEFLDDRASVGTSARQEISRNINELDQLIEEILLASRIDAREADLGSIESVDLLGLIAEECARVGAAMELGMPISVTSSDLYVPGIPKLLRRAVRNLLENARRYTCGDVVVHVQKNDTNTAEILVCDQGPGVPVELQSRIFEPFYRLPGASEKDGGVGLGLALVKSITERHGGSVSCTNRAEGGACFAMRLPLAQVQILD